MERRLNWKEPRTSRDVEELEDLTEKKKARRQLWREQSRKREEKYNNRFEEWRKEKDTAQLEPMSKEREEAQPDPTVEMETTNSQEETPVKSKEATDTTRQDGSRVTLTLTPNSNPNPNPASI